MMKPLKLLTEIYFAKSRTTLIDFNVISYIFYLFDLAANTLRGECRMYLEEEEETIEIID